MLAATGSLNWLRGKKPRILQIVENSSEVLRIKVETPSDRAYIICPVPRP